MRRAGARLPYSTTGVRKRSRDKSPGADRRRSRGGAAAPRDRGGSRMSTTQRPFQAEIERALRLLHVEGSTIEIRAPKTPGMGTARGYYTDLAKARQDGATGL